ncbi:MAG: N-acetylmuramoyl-L-alanine amidase [Actinomycetes bacterium]
MQAYRRGDHGPAVSEIRSKLGSLGLLSDPGDRDTFDDACDRAVRHFQQARGLTVDGVVGRETYVALDEARWRLGDRVLSYTVSHPFVGDDVVELQQRLNEMGFDCNRVDGIFGASTETALREFQRNVGLPPDGTCGPQTLKELDRMVPRAVGGRPEELRESEQLRRAGPALAGKLVVIDPGHGGDDPGVQAHGLSESDIVAELAAKVEGRLSAAGAQAFLTRGPDGSLGDDDRASFANAAEADLVVSLHVDGNADAACHGIATYYYGTLPSGSSRGRRSVVGERLAELVQEEVVARTDFLDCRTHAKSWELLRGTRMPTVRVEVGYLTNPGDAARLSTAPLLDSVAEGIVAAIGRLYLPVDADVITGELRIPALG